MKLLFIDCCISQRGERSRTLALANAYLSAFREKHPTWEIERVDVAAAELSPFTAAGLSARDALARSGDFSAPIFDQARRFRAADSIVVAAPFWDLSFPAALRTYIEYICANGVTYHYDETGCHGDCRAERLVYLTSAGSFESTDSLGVLYWRQLCAMFGIPRFDYVFAGGLDADPAAAPALLEKACTAASALA